MHEFMHIYTYARLARECIFRCAADENFQIQLQCIVVRSSIENLSIHFSNICRFVSLSFFFSNNIFVKGVCQESLVLHFLVAAATLLSIEALEIPIKMRKFL